MARYLEERRHGAPASRRSRGGDAAHLAAHAHRRGDRLGRVRRAGGHRVPGVPRVRVDRRHGDAASAGSRPTSRCRRSSSSSSGSGRSAGRSWWRRVLRVHGRGRPVRTALRHAWSPGLRGPSPWSGCVLAVAGAVLTVRYVRSDPMEYDTNKIQSDRHAVAEVHRLFRVAMGITGFVGLDGMAVMTDRVDQVRGPEGGARGPPRRRTRRRQAVQGRCTRSQDFVPTDQETKIPILLQLRQAASSRPTRAAWCRTGRRSSRTSRRRTSSPSASTSCRTPSPGHSPRRDGTRGPHRLHQPHRRRRHLRRALPAALGGRLPEHHPPGRQRDPGLGPGGDLRRHVERHPPRRPAGAGGVLPGHAAHRGARLPRTSGRSAQVILTLLVGVFWMVGMLALAGFKLNFLNFIALPVTFGIGVDYAVNIVQRDLELRDPLEVLRRTGGAVVLCSLTTLLGYLALAARSTTGCGAWAHRGHRRGGVPPGGGAGASRRARLAAGAGPRSPA